MPRKRSLGMPGKEGSLDRQALAEKSLHGVEAPSREIRND